MNGWSSADCGALVVDGSSIGLPLGIMRINGYEKVIWSWQWLIWGVAALMVLLALWGVVTQTLKWWTKPSKSPDRLLRQLIAVHKLRKAERSMIQSMLQKLPKGAGPLLFVDPSIWEQELGDGQPMSSEKAGLYEKIFGFPPERTAPS